MASVAGLPVLALLPERERHAFLPALPVLGIAGLVVVLHATALVMGVRAALPVLALGAIAVLVARRRARWWRVPLRQAGALVVALALGAPAFALAIAPLARVGDATVVQPTYNNDAFAYVTVTEWLSHHPATDEPDRAKDAPAFGYVRTHLDIGLRLGEELVQGVVAGVLRTDPGRTWYPVMALWVLLLPAAFGLGAVVLGMPRWAGWAAGAVAGLSSALLVQVFTQNSASLLGIVLVVPAVAMVGAVVGRAGPPLWIAALFLTALVGTYTEYVPLLAPGLAAYAVVAAWGRWQDAAMRVAVLLAVAVAIGPLVWFNATRSLLTNAGFTAPGSVSAYLDVTFPVALARFLGVIPYDVTQVPVARTAALGAVLAVAIVVALAWGRFRWLWTALVIGSAAMVVYLGTVHRFPYGHQRAVEILHPLWAFVAAVGVAVAVARAKAVALAVVIAVLGVYVHANVATVRPIVEWPLALARSVDDDLRDAESWFEEVAGSQGEHGMVVDPEFFQQHWTAYALRDRPRTAFPFVFQDYHGIPRYQLFDGRLRRFALVARSAWVSADAGVEVGGNSRYRFLDLSRGEALIVAPAHNFHPPEQRGPARWASWMIDDGELVVLHTPGVARMRLEAWALDDVAPLRVDVRRADGPSVGTYSFGTTTTAATIDLPPEATLRLVLDNVGTAAPPRSGTDPRTLSLYVEDAARA